MRYNTYDHTRRRSCRSVHALEERSRERGGGGWKWEWVRHSRHGQSRGDCVSYARGDQIELLDDNGKGHILLPYHTASAGQSAQKLKGVSKTICLRLPASSRKTSAACQLQ